MSADSRRVEPGDAFLAMPGGRLDGHEFAAEAARRGAVALVVERFLPDPLPQLQVPSVIAAAGTVASACYGPLREGLLLAGVTGTNGKTTTCQLLAACLGESARPAAQVGTTGVHLGRRLLASSVLTTPQAPDLQAVLAALALAGAPAAAVEISSHGLARRRVDGLVFDVAVFTNLSPEHLDFHGDMEAYFAAKRRLFEAGRCRRAVVCVDSEWGRRLAREISVPVTTFGSTADADVLIEIEARGLEGLEVRLRLPEGEAIITSPLIGAVNGANCAGAYLAAVAAGVAPDRAAAAIAACPAPPGRFEIVSSRGEGLVVIDYAHTPDALAALLATTRSIVPGRVTFVLGARGGRYHAKRADMARVASGADAVVFTADSPGDEDPASILDDLVAGVPPEHGEVDVEPDRRRAIERAIGDLPPDGAVLVTGRGHEAVQHFGTTAVILDDRVVARFALGARPPQGAPRPATSASDAAVPSPGAPTLPPGAPTLPPSRSSGVAVVVPARDAEATIVAAISSALAQEPAPDEVIVVDDGSCDSTAEVVAALAGPIRLLQQGPLGPSAARNAAIAAASSSWVAFLDADDEWLPGKLAAQLDATAASPGCVLCATDWRRPAPGPPAAVSGRRSEPARSVSRHDLLVLNRFQTSTVLARREALCRVGGFDASLDGSEDWDCWMRLSALGTVIVVPRPLVLYRDNPDGVSKNLQRVYSTAIEAVGRQLGGAATAGSPPARPSWSGQQLAAWHHLRFAVAFALARDRPSALGCLRDLARAGLVPAALPAGARLLLPFLAGRALRRAGAGGAGPRGRPVPVP